VDQVEAEVAERIELDAAVPVRRSGKKGSVSAAASEAWQKAKSARSY